MSNLSAGDWYEIEQLYASYAHGVDSGNWDAMVNRIFAADGVNDFTDFGRPPTVGRKAIAHDYGLMEHPIAHLTTNLLVRDIKAPDHIEVMAKYLVVVAVPDKDTGDATVRTGHFIDQIRKTQEGWRFTHRKIERLRRDHRLRTQ